MPQNREKRQQKSNRKDSSGAFEPIRLNKALAAAGICSRRKADELISQGRVTVNGSAVTELGLKVLPDQDKVSVDGRMVAIIADQDQKYDYIIVNKPVQVVTTAYDPEGRETVMDFLPPSLARKRLYPVGRLDYFSEGLLLLTNDGDLTYRLTHPKHHLPKVYEVFLRELLNDSQLTTMRNGMTLAEGEKLAPVEANLDPADPHKLRLVLHQGINRQIRRMCRDLGLTILKLKRTDIGPLHLGGLPSGQCRELRPEETAVLKETVGLKP